MEKVKCTLPGKWQRGSVIVIFALSLFVLIGFAALAIDFGHFYTARSELQNVADAAALAGTRYLGAVYINLDPSEMGSHSFTKAEVFEALQEVANQNKASNKYISIDINDVKIGFWDVEKCDDDEDGSADDVIDANGVCGNETLTGPDAVRVIARRDSSSINDAITTFFARVFGIESMNVEEATAIAALTGPSTIDELTTPFGLSELLFPNDCKDKIYFNPSASCAGWHNFIWDHNANDMSTIALGIIKRHVSETPGMSSGEAWLENFPINIEKLDSDLEKILESTPIPEVYETGEYFDFQGGPITTLFNGSFLINYDGNVGDVEGTPEHAPAPFFALFDYFRFRDNDNDNTKWTAIVPVYKETDSCQTASGQTEIVGFARVEILMPVGPPDKMINVKVDCKLAVVDGRGSGTTYGNLKGTIPNLVK